MIKQWTELKSGKTRIIFQYRKDFKNKFPDFYLVYFVITIRGGELEKGEGDRKVKEEKKHRGIQSKKSYFAKTISDFLHNCSVQRRSDNSG